MLIKVTCSADIISLKFYGSQSITLHPYSFEIQDRTQFSISEVYQMFQIMFDLFAFMNPIFMLGVTNSFQFGILTR